MAEHSDNIIFGIHPIREALRSGKKLERLYLSRGRKDHAIAEIFDLARAQGVDVRFEPWERLTVRAGQTTSHQGVVGIMATYTYVTVEELLSTLPSYQDPPFLLILDSLQDPHNLGAILRSAEGAGVQGVILPKDRSVGVTPTVVKVSAGATAYLPICRVTNLAAAIDQLKANQLWIVGTSGTAPQRYTEVDWQMPLALIIGNEEKGMRRLVTEKCDLVVSIPLSGKIASLNASVAAAIVMFEIRRQREEQ